MKARTELRNSLTQRRSVLSRRGVEQGLLPSLVEGFVAYVFYFYFLFFSPGRSNQLITCQVLEGCMWSSDNHDALESS